MSTSNDSCAPEDRHGEYVRVEILAGVPRPISVWLRVEHCDDKRKIVYGIIDDNGIPQLDKALRSGTKLAASYRQIRERRAA